MSRRPRAVKFSLAVRKNIRGGWENKRGELEQRLSDILGQPWTISADPWALYPYADEYSWAQQCLGDAISSYVEGGVYQLNQFVERQGDEVKDEINEICSAHVLTLDYDDTNIVDYCGVRVSPDGKLMIVFNEHQFGTNASQAAESNNLIKALNDAPSPKPMSFIVRSSIRRDYDPRIKEIQGKLSKIVKQELALVPNFEANFEKLKGKAGDDLNWHNFGNAHLSYFDALVSQLEYQKFGDDDILQEGLLEIMPKNEVHIRVVDQIKRTYNEVIAEDGILYLQTTQKHFGVNTSEVAIDIVNIL